MAKTQSFKDAQRFVGWLKCTLLGFLLSGCAAPVEPARNSYQKVCEVHKTALVRTTGYFPTAGLVVDPSQDYLQFMSEFEDRHFPHTTPITLRSSPAPGWDLKMTVDACPQCDREFKREFALYLKSDEHEKKSRWIKHLSRPSY